MLVHQRPSHPHMELAKVEVLPLQSGQFAPAQSGRHVEKHNRPLPKSEGGKKRLHLFDFENVRYEFTFSGDPNSATFDWASDWIPVRELPTDRMVENATHGVADFFSRAACQWLGCTELSSHERLKPFFKRHRLYRP